MSQPLASPSFRLLSQGCGEPGPRGSSFQPCERHLRAFVYSLHALNIRPALAFVHAWGPGTEWAGEGLGFGSPDPAGGEGRVTLRHPGEQESASDAGGRHPGHVSRLCRGLEGRGRAQPGGTCQRAQAGSTPPHPAETLLPNPPQRARQELGWPFQGRLLPTSFGKGARKYETRAGCREQEFCKWHHLYVWPGNRRVTTPALPVAVGAAPALCQHTDAQQRSPPQGLPGAGGPGVWSRKGQTGLAPCLGQTEPRDPVWLCEGLRPRNRWLSPWWVWTADTSRGACLGRHKPPSFWGHVKNHQDVLNQTTCLAKRVCFLPQLSPRWEPCRP